MISVRSVSIDSADITANRHFYECLDISTMKSKLMKYFIFDH